MIFIRKTKANNKGFSLVELMIVVAIIGLLAAIGVPQYAKFQARARQSEAKASLGAMYSAQQSFFQEWNCYSSDLRNIGFGVTGSNLRYVTGFSTAAPVNGAGCNTGVPAVNGAGFAISDGNGTAAVVLALYPDVNTTPTWAGAAAQLALARGQMQASAVAPGAGVFTAASAGDPRNTIGGTVNADKDTWTINQAKTVSNSNPRL